jgi:hypothetical protein
MKTNTRRTVGTATILASLGAWGLAAQTARAQPTYDRLIRAEDISFSPAPDGSGMVVRAVARANNRNAERGPPRPTSARWSHWR